MKLILTSSPSGALDVPNYDKVLDESNGFVQQLKQYNYQYHKGLIIAAFPSSYEGNDEMCDFFYQAFNHSGIPLDTLDLWDNRTSYTIEQLYEYDLIMLAGGHVPTQNAFFKSIDLKNKIKDFQGIVIGVSAGTMNAASTVYALPEENGEAIDPHYQRFISGLGLTDINVLPHYQMVKDYYLDGYRLYEDIVYNDSYGHPFIVLEDGSYIVVENNQSIIYGRSYLIYNHEITLLCDNNESTVLE